MKKVEATGVVEEGAEKMDQVHDAAYRCQGWVFSKESVVLTLIQVGSASPIPIGAPGEHADRYSEKTKIRISIGRFSNESMCSILLTPWPWVCIKHESLQVEPETIGIKIN